MISFAPSEVQERPLYRPKRGKLEEFIDESRVVIREYRTSEGKTRLEMEIEGDGLALDADSEVSTSFAVAATMFAMFNDGSVLARMNSALGFKPNNVEIRLESTNGIIPGNA